ncbi:Uncharacterized protein Rs2_48330 [Raphanus sativus]|nr:Uncharacterized protein Rs2_48330 [Raphanus sativus]
MRSSAGREETSSHMVVPYEQTSQLLIHSKQSRREGNSSGATRSRKLASAIVSPHGVAHPMAMEENVTVRNKFEGRILSFSSSEGNNSGIKDDQMIEALNDMESMDQTNGGLLDDEMEGDDLLGLDLMEMENTSSVAAPKEVGDGQKGMGRSIRRKTVQVRL